ncbi:MAG: hypothetical protein JWQ87_5366 [Candidatus Sulfotelmatobacter sp.]|nr:hypothetical protein [Candidatus Sulfotelmatobacter sp.]
MLQDLVATLNAVGKTTELYQTDDGTRLLILPYGGRILGVYAPGSEENFLWTNSALESVESARAYYASDDWQNSGGDRTWLAPEVDFFFPKFPDIDIAGYWQPRSLDPGNYEVTKTVHGVKLINRLKIDAFRSRKRVELEITKSVASAPNPLRYDGNIQIADVEYAGHTLLTSLKIIDPDPDRAPLVGLWSLTQMPHQGELYVPTYSKTEPRIYFGLVDKLRDELAISDRLVRFKMRAAGEHKIGIRAAGTTGRIGYMYGTGNKRALIIRNFFVNPSGEYADVPWTEPEDRGYCTQACSVNSRWGMFSEMEYHVPAIGGDTGLRYVEDRSQLWAFRGSKEDVEKIARTLLSAQI